MIRTDLMLFLSLTGILKMVNLFQNLFGYGPLLLVLSLPLVFSLCIAYRSSSWRRVIAVMLTCFAGFIFAIETYSLLQKGNLTALLTMLSAPVVLVCILVLAIAEGIAKRIRSPEVRGTPSEPLNAPNEKVA